MKNSAPKNSKQNDGPRHWRSLEHKADSPEFREFVEKEFPSVDLIDDPVSRRNFMKIMSASFALAGLGAPVVAGPSTRFCVLQNAGELCTANHSIMLRRCPPAKRLCRWW